MYKSIFIILCLFALTSCALFPIHKMDITQGNIITPNELTNLHIGMNAASVKNLLGEPLLLNTFNDERMDYVYTFKPGYGKSTEKYLTLRFAHGILKEIKGNMYSPFIK